MDTVTSRSNKTSSSDSNSRLGHFVPAGETPSITLRAVAWTVSHFLAFALGGYCAMTLLLQAAGPLVRG
jgi:hypothetical protein